MVDVIYFIILFFSLIISALVSGAEIAFFSLDKAFLEMEQKDKRTKRILKLLDDPKKLLATILVTNNFINVAIVLLSLPIIDILFKNIENDYLKFFLEIGLVTFLILLFGEILPKIYAKRNNLFFSKMMSIPLTIISKYILFWIIYPMGALTKGIEKVFNKKNKALSMNQISQALEMTSKKGTTKEENKILKGIISFGDIETRQVMCPRIDVFAIPEKDSLKKVIEFVRKKGFSRIPVYKESMDAITGILYVKDLLPHIHKKSLKWETLLKKPYYVPENKKLTDLLKEFQQNKIHLAIVVDEYGGTSGIITLEDIIEQIVGEITDEFDNNKDFTYKKIDDKNYIVDAKINLKEIYNILKIKDTSLFENNKKEAETLAGFILELVQRFPEIGEEIYFQNFIFKIKTVDKKRIKRVQITILK